MEEASFLTVFGDADRTPPTDLLLLNATGGREPAACLSVRIGLPLPTAPLLSANQPSERLIYAKK